MKSKFLVLNLLFIIYCLLFLPGTANAQFQNSSSNYYNTNPDVPNNLNTHVQSVFINVASTLSCILSGYDPVNPETPCLGIDPETKKLGYVEDTGGGLIGIAGNMIAFTYYIPVNTHDYGSYLAGNFGIARPAYAQGVGFQGLSPVMNLWEAFRNITYIIFVILFVIVGLGIMFRIKIDPRTVMTIQNQIPKIIIALVLVTFSYAIAGFLIDVMYVSMYIIISVFADQGIQTVDISAGSPFGAVGGIGGLSGIASGVAGTMSGIVASIFDGSLGKIISTIIGALIGSFASSQFQALGPVSTIAKGVIPLVTTLGGYVFGNQIIGYLAGVITYLIIIIALFSALLRLWFVLIKSYIYILLGVVFAPFYIAKGLIPGQSGIGAWTRSMAANLSVFPVTIIMFLLGKAFIEGFSERTLSGVTPFVPPMVGDFADPEGFGAILGLAIVLMTPEVANMTRDALKAPDLKYSSAVGKGLAVGGGLIAAPVKGVGGQLFGENRMGIAKPGQVLLNRALGTAIGGWLGGGSGRTDTNSNQPNATILPPPAQNFWNRIFRRNRNPGGGQGPQGGGNPPAGEGGPFNPPPRRPRGGGGGNPAQGGQGGNVIPFRPRTNNPDDEPPTPPAGGSGGRIRPPAPDSGEGNTAQDIPHGDIDAPEQEDGENDENRQQQDNSEGGENKNQNKEVLNEIKETRQEIGEIRRNQGEQGREGKKLAEDITDIKNKNRAS